MGKDILIIPSRTGADNPIIEFNGATASVIKLEVLPDGNVQFNSANTSVVVMDIDEVQVWLKSLVLGAGTAAMPPIQLTSGDLTIDTAAGQVEFNLDDYYVGISSDVSGGVYANLYPPAHNSTYVKATDQYYSGTGQAYFATDPAKSLTGAAANNAWWTGGCGANITRFHIDAGSMVVVNRLYYENYHNSGGSTTFGAKDFTLWGSNEASAFNTLTANDDTNWTQITGVSQSIFDQHATSDSADPKYIAVANTIAYRYYAIKISSNHAGVPLTGLGVGLRRIVLQNGNPSYRVPIVLADKNKLTATKIPLASTNGRLIDSKITYTAGTDLFTIGADIGITGTFQKDIKLTNTTNANQYGVIQKGAKRFIHDFNYGNNGTVTTEGKNIFIGEEAGNFTMGASAGAAHLASYNVGIGYRTLYGNTTGTNNIAIGKNSLVSNTTGNGNVAIGYQSMTLNTTGENNTAVGGYYTLGYLSTGSNNVCIGSATGKITTGSDNVAIGYNCMFGQSVTGSFNIAIGQMAGGNITSGVSNFFAGYRAGLGVTTTGANIAIGNTTQYAASGSANITFGTYAGFYLSGSYNIGIGDYALGKTDGTSAGNHNIALGNYALAVVSSGNGNISFGYYSLGTNNTGSYGIAIGYNSQRYANDTTTPWTNSNISIGYLALRGSTTAANNTGNQNVAIGYESMLSNTSGGYNTSVGYQTLLSNTTGYRNVAVGYQTLYSNTQGYWNVAIGSESMASNIDGYANVAIGHYALRANTSGYGNFAMGIQALSSATGNANIAIGYQAMVSATTGSQNIGIGNAALGANTGSSNIAIGNSALAKNTSGGPNIAIGQSALANVETGYGNIGIGYRALIATTGSNNVCIGYDSLISNTSGGNNIGIGSGALQANTTSGDNTAIGHACMLVSTGAENAGIGSMSLRYNTSGAGNVAVGYSSLFSNKTGNYGTAIGYYSQYYANDTVTPWTNSNVSIGYNSLRGSATAANNTGNQNVAIGYEAMLVNTTGSYNVAIGYNALRPNSIGASNVGIGGYALYNNTEGNANVGIGRASLYSVTTGTYNTGFGQESGWGITTGNYNTAIGYGTMQGALTGSYNIAAGAGSMGKATSAAYNISFGAYACHELLTGQDNTSIGSNAMRSNKAGNYGIAVGYGSQQYCNDQAGGWTNSNVSIGYQALRGSTTAANNTGTANVAIGYESMIANTSGNYNTAVGYNSLKGNTTGSENSALGLSALYSNTTGSGNVSIGNYALQFITTSNNNTAVGFKSGRFIADGITANISASDSLYLGYMTRPKANGENNQIVIGYAAIGLGSNTVVIGNSSITITRLQGSVGIGTDNPQRLLHVSGGAADTYIEIQGGNNSGTQYAGIECYNNGGTALWRLYGNSGTGNFELGVGSTFQRRIYIDYTTGSVQIGSATDYTEFENDGTRHAVGAATTYRDELNNLVGQKLESPSSDIVTNYTECTLDFKTSAKYNVDFAFMNIQINHDWLIGTPIFPHLHWIQAEENTPNWIISYRWQINGGEKQTTWTPLIWNNSAFSWGGGSLNQITSFGNIEPPPGAGLSDILQIKLHRDTNNDSLAFGDIDNYTLAAQAYSFDIHIECDTDGSRSEYTK